MRNFLFGACLLFSACGTAAHNDRHTSIDFTNPLPFKSEDHVLKREFINLEFNENGFFSDVDKVIFVNDKIYLLEKMTKLGVICFDINGEYLYTIGKFGEGPEEFQNISDMNLDHEGNLVFLDRAKNTMFTYGSNNKLLNIKKLPFRAQSFIAMDDYKWAFSMVNDNDETIYQKAKMIFTDLDFNNSIINSSYQEGELGVYYHIGHFTSDGENILFYKAVSDSLICFDSKGNLLSSLFLDFGYETLPQDIQYNMSKIFDLKPTDKFSYLTTTPRILDHYILGLNSGSAAPGTFLTDLKSGQTYTTLFEGKEISHTEINKPVGQIGSKAFINYINADMAGMDRDFNLLPKNVQDHLNKEGTTLIIHYLK